MNKYIVLFTSGERAAPVIHNVIIEADTFADAEKAVKVWSTLIEILQITLYN